MTKDELISQIKERFMSEVIGRFASAMFEQFEKKSSMKIHLAGVEETIKSYEEAAKAKGMSISEFKKGLTEMGNRMYEEKDQSIKKIEQIEYQIQYMQAELKSTIDNFLEFVNRLEAKE